MIAVTNSRMVANSAGMPRFNSSTSSTKTRLWRSSALGCDHIALYLALSSPAMTLAFSASSSCILATNCSGGKPVTTMESTIRFISLPISPSRRSSRRVRARVARDRRASFPTTLAGQSRAGRQSRGAERNVRRDRLHFEKRLLHVGEPQLHIARAR